MLPIEVAYATPQRQVIIPLQVFSTCNIEQAIGLSGILTEFPEINPTTLEVGIFGKRASLKTEVHAGDRIEIYRPLLVDPKQARRLRAKRGLTKYAF